MTSVSRGPAATTAADAAAGPDPAVRLSVASDHGCTISAEGRLACWGYGGHGALAFPVGVRAPDWGVCSSPTRVPDVQDIAQVTTALGRTCVRDRSGRVQCFGTSDSAAPGGLEGIAAVDVALGPGALCVVDGGGAIRCSESTHGGSPEASAYVVAGARDAAAVAVGLHQACARTTTGEAYCWPLGAKDPTAQRVELPGAVFDITVGDDVACAVVTGGAVWCWGEGWRGELGKGEDLPRRADGSAHEPLRAVAIPSARPAKRVRAGRHHVCALRQDGRVDCWGDVAFGARTDRCTVRTPRGGATLPCSRAPVVAPELSDATDLVAVTTLEGEGGACVLRADGSVRCAGARSTRPTPGYPPGVLDLASPSVEATASCPPRPGGTADAASFPEGAVPSLLRPDGRCLRDHERCPTPTVAPSCAPDVAPIAVDVLADRGPSLLGKRVALRGVLAPGPTVVPDVFCGGDCCRTLTASLTLVGAPRAFPPDERAYVELRRGAPASALRCTGDDSLLCCPWAMPEGATVVVGTLRSAPDHGGHTRYSLDDAARCAPSAD